MIVMMMTMTAKAMITAIMQFVKRVLACESNHTYEALMNDPIQCMSPTCLLPIIKKK